MEYRKIAATGEEISILGYGGMRFPTHAGKIDEVKATQQLRDAIDAGLNYIDTAYFYHGGQSEPFIGRALKEGYREKVKIATKMPPWLVSHPKDFDVILNEQLQRLQVAYIDFYLLHALNRESWEKFKALGVFDFLNKEKEKGTLKNIGFSFHGDRDVFKEIIDAYPWTFCQIQYNFLDDYNQAGLEGLRYAYEKGVSVFVMEPLRGGNLVNKLPEAVTDLYQALHPNWTPAEWALKWIWNHKEVTMILSGMTEDAHIEENLRISKDMKANAMTQAELDTIKEVKQIYLSLQKVPCTGCQYCLPCPFGVDIPRCFDLYNSKYVLNQKVNGFYWMQMGGMNGKPSYASLCRNCGKCVEHCPQSIAIPEKLKDVIKDMENPVLRSAVKVASKAMKIYTVTKRKFRGATQK